MLGSSNPTVRSAGDTGNLRSDNGIQRRASASSDDSFVMVKTPSRQSSSERNIRKGVQASPKNEENLLKSTSFSTHEGFSSSREYPVKDVKSELDNSIATYKNGPKVSYEDGIHTHDEGKSRAVGEVFVLLSRLSDSEQEATLKDLPYEIKQCIKYVGAKRDESITPQSVAEAVFSTLEVFKLSPSLVAQMRGMVSKISPDQVQYVEKKIMEMSDKVVSGNFGSSLIKKEVFQKDFARLMNEVK